MLPKPVVNCNEFNKSNLRAVLKIQRSQDLALASKLLKDHKFRGIQVDSKILTNSELANTNFNYFSIISNNIDSTKTAITKVRSDKSFIELIVPIEQTVNFLNEDIKVQRLILDIQNKEQSKYLDVLFAEIVLRRLFPLTKGLPFCHADIMHTIEIHQEPENKPKPKACNSCKVKSHCPYKGGNFIPIPITDPDKDLLRYLE